MENKEFSDTNNELINKLLFLQNKLNKLHEIESQFDQLEDAMMEKDAFDDYGSAKGITSRGTTRILNSFTNSLNRIRRRKFIEKEGLTSNFDQSSIIDIELLVSEFYNLAFETKGNTNDFIYAIENSEVEEIYQFNKYMNAMHPRQKEKYLSSMVYVMSNQQTISSLKNVVNTEGKWSLSETEKNMVDNHLSHLEQAENELYNLEQSRNPNYNLESSCSETAKKYSEFKRSFQKIKNGEQTNGDYLNVLRILTPKGIKYSALINNKNINMGGCNVDTKTLIDKMIRSGALYNKDKPNNLYFYASKPYIEAIVDSNRKFTAYTIKESIEIEIETIKQKLDLTVLNPQQRMNLKLISYKSIDLEEGDYYYTQDGKKKLGRVQPVDMGNFNYSNTSKPPITIKKFDNELEIEINNIIKKYSVICAALAIQPIPFADIFILTPTQILMGKKIADIRGYEIKENSIELILKEISGIIGMGIIAQQLVIGAYKTFLPFFGAITTIPAVYGLTYGIGKSIDYYITAKINGNQINKSELEKIFKSSREIGEREGKLREEEIQISSKKK